MSLFLNTNLSSLQAQNNLTTSTNQLSQATEDLSSGLSINSAADNAAGYAIATNFQTQIGGLGQASQNASDAINLAQTAGSALAQITSTLQSVRDLAVQATNGTNSSADLADINTSVQQQLDEVTRIANQTSFNGINVLNGSVSSLSFQVGSNVGQAINVQLGQGVTASQVGQISEVSTASLSGAFVDASGNAATLNLSGLSITGADGTSYTFTGSVVASSAQDVADDINAAGVDGVTAAVNASGGINIYSSGELSVSGAALTGGVSSASTGSAINFTASATGFGASGLGSTATGLASSGAAYVAGSTLSASGSLLGGDTLTVDDANQLISRVDAALSTISTDSSNLGAVQDRFQSAISTISAEQTNLTASQSTIQDTDYAAETATLSQSQVLQQAGISVLATANSAPQNILKLLQS